MKTEFFTNIKQRALINRLQAFKITANLWVFKQREI